MNLQDYFNTTKYICAGYTLLKNNDFAPPEVELLKEIGELKEKIKICTVVEKKKLLTKTLHKKNLALTMILERNRRKR